MRRPGWRRSRRAVADGGIALVESRRDLGAGPELHATTEICRFTSGSTGVPTVLEFSGQAVANAASNWAVGTGMTIDERVFCLAGLANGLAFNTSLLSVFTMGATLVLLEGLSGASEVLRVAASEEVTSMVAFPVLVDAMLRCSDRQILPRSVKRVISAGAPLAVATRDAFRDTYGIEISDYYGVAECGPCTFELDPGRREGLGTPLPGVTLCIADETEEAGGIPVGRVLVRTESMATRYLNVPGRFEARVTGGFFDTLDLGHVDQDGRLFLHGHVSATINRSGRKIDPAEVEARPRSMPGVTDAALIEHRGESPTASRVVLAVVSETPIDPLDVLLWLRAGVAKYKLPSPRILRGRHSANVGR